MKVGDLVVHFPSNQKGRILKIDHKGWCKVRFLFKDAWVHPRSLNKENEE